MKKKSYQLNNISDVTNTPEVIRKNRQEWHQEISRMSEDGNALKEYFNNNAMNNDFVMFLLSNYGYYNIIYGEEFSRAFLEFYKLIQDKAIKYVH